MTSNLGIKARLIITVWSTLREYEVAKNGVFYPRYGTRESCLSRKLIDNDEDSVLCLWNGDA